MLERDRRGPAPLLGAKLTVNGAPGSPQLTVVGLATSVTGTADAWVLPAELAKLRGPARSPWWTSCSTGSPAPGRPPR